MAKKPPEVVRGEVFETVGRRVRVRVDGEPRLAPVRGVQAVVGDQVVLTDGVVTEVAPRRTTLFRAGPILDKVICANVTMLVSMNATLDPPFRPGLIDRLLVTASANGLEAAILLNKCDMGMPEPVLERMAWYESLGVPIFLVSVAQQKGLDSFVAHIRLHTAVLVGHSGVGKTSLLRALVPGVDREVGELDAWGRGRHTTTSTILLDLPGGGRIVDIPGVREFGLGNILPDELRQHFPELAELRCRYHDCAHDGDDGCIAEERCDPERLASYRKLLGEIRGE